MRVLVVDDEPPARDRMTTMLGEHPDVQVVAAVGDVPQALAVLNGADGTTTTQPVDAVFLDINLPGLDGFGLLDLLGRTRRPAVVCVTAYCDHAVRAFDEAAVDYLLKPYSRERLAEALARVRDHVAGSSERPAPASPLTRIPVPSSTGVRFVEASRVVLVRSERNYVRLHVLGEPRTVGAPTAGVLVRATLTDMERRLPAGEYVRANRSAIVRLDAVVELRPLHHGEAALRLTSGHEVVTGRQHTPAIRAALGL